MYKTWADMTTKEYKKHKNLRKQSLRDNMTNTELVLNMLAKVARTYIEHQTGKPAISPQSTKPQLLPHQTKKIGQP